LTIRCLLLLAGLTGLNLGAAVAVHRCPPAETLKHDFLSFGFSHYEAGHTGAAAFFYDGAIPGTPERLRRVLIEPARLTPPQVWCPIIASLSITLLVFVALPLRSTPNDLAGSQKPGWKARPKLTRVAAAARWTAFTLALLALNAAATIYRPCSAPNEAEPARQYLKGGLYLLFADGSFAFERPWRDLVFAPYRDIDPQEPFRGPLLPGNHPYNHDLNVRTIVLEPDGSILGYEGKPGQMTSQPLVLRRPLRSTFEMRWPIVGSATITVLILGQLWRHARRRRTVPAAETEKQVARLDSE
jgi:hypothetical protein